MLVFPQFSTGASSLYPLTHTARQRTVVNTLGDGSINVYADPEGRSLAWELHATGLTEAEWNAIETLFKATAGMWQSFTFLNPVGNLIADSETFGAAAWINGALIDLTTGVSDPLGTTRATGVANTSETTLGIAQVLSVPGNFHYCLSLWGRTDSGTSVTLTISTSGRSISKTFALSTQWSRVSFTANLGQATESVTFAAQLSTGGTIDIFGMQVEAQLGSSDYKLTGTQGGVYANARFGADQLTVTAQGPDVYDAVIQIVNTEN